MNLFGRMKMNCQKVRFGGQPLDRGMLDSIIRFAWQTVVPEPSGKIDIQLIEKAEWKMSGGRKVQAPYYLQFFSDNSRESCLNAGYVAGQTAAYMRFRGIAASVLRTVPDWMQQGHRDGMRCVAVLAFGCRDAGAQRNRNGSSQEVSCIRLEKEECWSEEILEFMKEQGMICTEFTRMVFRSGRLHFLLKVSARKHPQQSAVDAGVMIANVMAAAEELWIDLEIIKQQDITEAGYLLSIRRRDDRSGEAYERSCEAAVSEFSIYNSHMASGKEEPRIQYA